MAITFPERPYLTYSELLKRWQCSEDDLRYQIVSQGLKPVVKESKMLISPEWTCEVDNNCAYGNLIDLRCGGAVKEMPRGWLYLQEPKQTEPLNCEFTLGSNVRDPDKPEYPWDASVASWFWLSKTMDIELVKSEAVFLMSEVLRFESKHDQEAAVTEEEKPLKVRERNTLLTIIAALAKEAKLNIDSPGKSSLFIEGLTDQLNAPVSKRAIEEHLKRIPEALRARSILSQTPVK